MRAREPQASAHLANHHPSLSFVCFLPPPRNAERSAKKQGKAAKKAVRELEEAFKVGLPPEPPEPPEPQWREIDKDFWLAYAVDGKGHHDGACEYDVTVPRTDFGDSFLAGGEARWTDVNGGYPETIYRLPDVEPPASGGVRFRLRVCPEGMTGRVAMVGGLQVRARA